MNADYWIISSNNIKMLPWSNGICPYLYKLAFYITFFFTNKMRSKDCGEWIWVFDLVATLEFLHSLVKKVVSTCKVVGEWQVFTPTTFQWAWQLMAALVSLRSLLFLRRPQMRAATNYGFGWPSYAPGIEPSLPECESGVLATTLTSILTWLFVNTVYSSLGGYLLICNGNQ